MLHIDVLRYTDMLPNHFSTQVRLYIKPSGTGCSTSGRLHEALTIREVATPLHECDTELTVTGCTPSGRLPLRFREEAAPYYEDGTHRYRALTLRQATT